MFKGKVDETFEHAVELGRLCSNSCCALVGVLGHQAIKLSNIDLVAGKPEFHLDLVLAELVQGHCRAIRCQVHRLHQQLLQPEAQGVNPARPVTPVATLANHALERLIIRRHLAKTFQPRPFEQAVEERSGVGTTRETMDIAAAGHHFAQLLRVGALIIEQLLCLRAVCRQGQRLLTNTQRTVGGDPPIFRRTTFGLSCRQKLGLIAWCTVALFVRLRFDLAGNRRATGLQRLQPVTQLAGSWQRRPATEQIAQRRTVEQ
ncbi:hypothetical protein D3C78_523980 [compost metagenome]